MIRYQNNCIRYDGRTPSANKLCELMENESSSAVRANLKSKKIR